MILFLIFCLMPLAIIAHSVEENVPESKMKFLSLQKNSGQMPMVGSGTWEANDEESEKAFEQALEAGYRHIDTSALYGNEHNLGKVLDKWLKSGKVKREDLFISTKLPIYGNIPKNVEPFLKESLEKLKLDYVDLYYIPTPFSFIERADLYSKRDDTPNLQKKTDHVGIWKEMEKQVDAGRAKAIGLANFNSTQILNVLKSARIPPSALQVELHTYFQQKDLHKFCKEHNIALVAFLALRTPGNFSSFASFYRKVPNLLEDPTIVKIADKHKKTAAQIILRHIVQRGIAVISDSTNAESLKQNIEIFDFQLSDEEMEQLRALDKGNKGRISDFTFLKGIEQTDDYPFHTDN